MASFNLALIALGLASAAQAQFFSVGHNAMTRTRLDPIVSPGRLASHVHLFSGTNAIDANMNHASAVGADCTTSPLGADKSGYWAPQLYYKWKNGTYSAISGDGIVTYWLNRGNDVSKGEVSVVVPDDFRMVAGNMTRDFWDMKIPSHDAVSFECFGPGYDHRLPYIPGDFECDTIRPQIFFPNCWNGVDSYKPDNSHVSYPLGDYQNGKCPTGFKRIPSLFMETYYKPKLSIGAGYEWYPGCLVLSNGDNMGLTFHADWLNGFPKGLLVDAFAQCPNMNADFSSCPLLAQYKQTDSQKDCQMKGQIANEPVGVQTPLAKLPGNNPEFNSSREGNLPKQAVAYTETSSLITLEVAKGGSCKSQRCTDFAGARLASVDTSNNASMSASSNNNASMSASSSANATVSSSMNSTATGSTSSTATGSTSSISTAIPTVIQVGVGLNAGPAPTSSSSSRARASASASAGLSDDEEEVCTCQKRKKRRGHSQRLQGLY